jgi:hypothetical protein
MFALAIEAVSFLKLFKTDFGKNWKLLDCFVVPLRNSVLKRFSVKRDPCGNAQRISFYKEMKKCVYLKTKNGFGY